MTPVQEAKAELRLVKPDYRFSGEKLAEALESLDLRLKRLELLAKADAAAEPGGNGDDGHQAVEVRTPAPPALHSRKTRK
jgi:hypothetical protein